MQKLSKKKIIIISILFLALLGIIFAFIFNNKFSVLRGNPFSSSKLNILIIGYDSSINGPPRADTIIVSSVDLDTKEVGVLFIPRDTRVKIPGHGKNRINASHAFGGIKLVKKTIESFLNIPINYYVETDFDGFARIIDELGGIELTIEQPLNYVDEAGNLYINLPEGRQILEGEEALEYVRFREPTYGDIGRVKRQQKFIRALMERILDPDIIMKLPGIYREVRKSVNTNIPVQDISPFVHLVKEMDLEKVKSTMVPGEPRYINGASYWIAEEDKLEIIVNNLIRSKEYIKNNQYYISVLNGNGESGQAGELADELKKYGFKIENVGNADHFNHKQTLIQYYNKRDKAVVLKLQELLAGKIKFIDNSKRGIDIIIGEDYLKNKGWKNE